MAMKDGNISDNREKAGRGYVRVKLVALLVSILLALLVGARFSNHAYVQPTILGILSALAIAGVFFLFSVVVGVIRFSEKTVSTPLPFDLLDNIDDGMVVVENDRVIYANQVYRSFFHEGEPQIVGRLFAGAPEVSETIYRLAQAERDYRAATEEIRLSSSLTRRDMFAWYRIGVRPLDRKSGKAVLWTVTDVTKERQSQENVFRELQHAINYLDDAPAGFLSVDSAGAIVYMNATLAEWLGYDLAKVGSGGLSLHDVVTRNIADTINSMTGVLGEVRTDVFDLNLRKRNGENLPARLYHRVSFAENGQRNLSRTLVLNLSQKSTASEEQQIGEMQLSRFFNNTPIAIATVTRQGSIVRVNTSFSRLFGASFQSDKANHHYQIRDLIDASQQAELDRAIEAAHRGQAASQPLELRIAGGGDRSARVWVSAVEDDGGREDECAALYAFDTTEFRQVEEQLVQAQKMNAIGQLAGGVAHDFNNVLQAIIGYCDLLLSNHRPTDPSFQDIMQIKQNANRAASLVRQLLAFSRRQTLRPEVLNLSDRLSDLTMFLKRLLGERVELDFRHGRDLWPVLADVHQLEQVMMNLAVNARDAMPNGGYLSIRTENISAEKVSLLNVPGMNAGDYVLIETSDTGTGMSPQIMEKIFEPFFTTKDIGKGTGLGLSTVFGIVKQSGGFIDVRSELGQGTTFSIYLPRHVAEDIVPEVEIRNVPATTPTAVADMTGQGVILLVEDEDPVRAVNARALTARGYTVLEAASGFEALQLIEEEGGAVDLVISDVVMPEMDGPTLLGELRKRHADLKVIFVSGYAEEAFRKHLPEGEDFNFLPKPFGLKQLVETVKQVMRS